jgi:hypothetical protein
MQESFLLSEARLKPPPLGGQIYLLGSVPKVMIDYNGE